MFWYIIAGLSAALFFGFVIWCVCRFGLRSCYSAYGPLCRDNYLVNWWTVFTFLAPALLMPVLLEASIGKVWQFTGFLCTVCIIFIAFTPNYDRDKKVSTVHSALALLGALWSILYIIFNTPGYWWLLPAYLGACALACVFTGIRTWNFWLEMVAFLATYTAVFLII